MGMWETSERPMRPQQRVTGVISHIKGANVKHAGNTRTVEAPRHNNKT